MSITPCEIVGENIDQGAAAEGGEGEYRIKVPTGSLHHFLDAGLH